ncbi:hypothetical protein HPB50_027056 [Hyalomma asiaticum]|uniref:Uncharacterized protein n=1 Tax=Hyalomma asiaticum TaxID=266040 RepID=A0ACB7RR50_HYAAI|nr:hypothetical protein HPB50_027056 [Hyalomma asiaticum]
MDGCGCSAKRAGAFPVRQSPSSTSRARNASPSPVAAGVAPHSCETRYVPLQTTAAHSTIGGRRSCFPELSAADIRASYISRHQRDRVPPLFTLPQGQKRCTNNHGGD